MPSLTGYVSAAEWLAEAKQAVEHAVECLGQIPVIVVDVRDEMADVPSGRGYIGLQRRRGVAEAAERMESIEDGVIRTIAQLKGIDWTTIDADDVGNLESWGSAAAEAADRAGRR